MAMTCKFCGTEIKENETECSFCRTAVENTSVPAVEETSAPVVETPAPAVEEVKPEPVAAAPAAESKFVCSGCGKEYPAGTKFCSECGGKIEEKKPVIVQKEEAPKFVCTGCGKEYPAGTKFCSECGGKVEEVKPATPVVFACTGCGKEYPAGTKFCSECGGKVTAKGESEKEKSETVSFENSTLYNIYLQDCGNNNFAVIKEIRSITGRGLKEAKDLAESLPACLKKGCSAEEAEAIKKQFDVCGAVVKIVARGSKSEPQAVVKFTGFYCNNCSEEFDSDSEINCCCPTCNNKGIALRKMEFTNFTRTLEDCKYLVEHGTDLNLLWDSVVTWGVNEDSYEEIESDYEEYIRIAEYLLSKGADINYRNCPGYMNALEAAEEFGSDEMIKFLIEHGAKH